MAEILVTDNAATGRFEVNLDGQTAFAEYSLAQGAMILPHTVVPTVFEGRGAGAGPTASAVAADLMDIARGRKGPAFAVPASELKRMPAAPMERHRGEYYVRLTVVDRPGVIADVAAALRDERISMAAMIQRGKSPDNVVPVVLMTHETEEAAMARAMARIGALDSSVQPPRMIRIEAL